MRRLNLLLGAVGAATALAGGAATAILADPGRRSRLRRSTRLWWLGARRSVTYANVRLRGVAADEETRAQLNEEFVIRTAEDVARELGQMKGVAMKAGQMVSFIVEALPENARQALATLQADAPPMAPALAEQVVYEELGRRPQRLFRDWNPLPVAAASIGQVHHAVLRDGREVAVKVQYPGVGDAIGPDLANAELLYQLFSMFALKSLDVRGMVDELRQRIHEELDYRREAANQTEFGRLFANHPFIRIPRVVSELSTSRVLVSDWVDGQAWAQFERTATREAKETAAEVLFRFAQGSIYRYRVFNGDPHPGNYRFHPDGTVTFLDFGLVKRWTLGETEALWPIIDPLLNGDAQATTDHMVTAGFLPPDHSLDAEAVWAYVSAPYRPFLVDEFAFDRQYVGETLTTLFDVRGPSRPVIEKLNMPSSFVILDRVVWGMSALLGRLEARNRWRDILAEYRSDAPPVTPLGRLEQSWLASHPAPQP